MENPKIKEQFSQLYDKYYGEIYKFCLIKLGFNIEYAEDSTQNTFLVLYRNLSDGMILDNPRAYLYKTANNYVLKSFKDIKKHSQNKLDINESAYQLISENDIESHIDYISLISEISEVLNEEELQLLKMRYEQGIGLNEIAEYFGISRFACSKRLYRVKQKIQNNIKRGENG